MNNLFYRPSGAWVGDLIPYYHEDTFYLYYLHDERRNGVYGDTTWYETHTKDFVHYSEAIETIPRGNNKDQDFYAYTGDIIEVNGIFHMFYTGVNPNTEFCSDGRTVQAVMHAISKDLKTWKKIKDDTFFSPGGIYELHDWRDPFVFWNEEKEEYWMLLAARLKTGPHRRRGCIALCKSKDLSSWEVDDPFWAPNLYMTHECPDLFKIGDWWYLVYSTFSEQFTTHYRMSKNLEGPWIAPERDTFDGRAFYAAKTVSDGNKRFACAWNPTKKGEYDNGDWEWAGSMVIHELVQNGDGTLDVKLPTSIEKSFTQPKKADYPKVLGKTSSMSNGIELEGLDSFICAAGQDTSDNFFLTGNITLLEQTRGCGIMLKTSDDLNEAYYLRIEPQRNRLVFDQWPRKDWGTEQWQVGGDIPHAIELERPFHFKLNTSYSIKILVEGTMGVIYINNQVAMNFRMYDLTKPNWGVFVNEGNVKFEDFTLYKREVQ
ncbi:family 43 glycosylhydrolase [Gracilibacillus phocaeensis]|uniref:family 43 glycosylhydrolase n=1 Tax=Gracilibacillus phocaeensis TaxID=2042304 RepID=UPI0010310BC4|nr:family 43 glycosylhydrolase [Gracilibacillus phocaeensis]